MSSHVDSQPSSPAANDFSIPKVKVFNSTAEDNILVPADEVVEASAESILLCESRAFTLSSDTGVDCCILTPRLGDWISTQNSTNQASHANVQEIRFIIESHDQGWADGGEYRDRYAHSYTFFEAAIVRDIKGGTSDDNSEESSGDNEIRQALNSFRGQEARLASIGFMTLENPHDKSDSSKWLIQKNMRAHWETRRHVVRWTDVVEVDSSWGTEGMDATGRGLGQNFVRYLKAGDRIAVLARAVGPRWTNFVEKVQMQVYFSQCQTL